MELNAAVVAKINAHPIAALCLSPLRHRDRNVGKILREEKKKRVRGEKEESDVEGEEE